MLLLLGTRTLSPPPLAAEFSVQFHVVFRKNGQNPGSDTDRYTEQLCASQFWEAGVVISYMYILLMGDEAV